VFTLDQVVPWGRSFDEYRRMFALTDEDLGRSILGCADGPASFNAEATRQGVRVVSFDPLYAFTRSDIEARISATRDQVLEQTRLNAHEFVWGNGISDVEDLGRLRMAAMQTFLDDYDAGRRQRRYVNVALPSLPFPENAFGLALCSHFLFLYSAQLGETFHLDAMRDLCRVAEEVRVFPLLALGGERSPFVEACIRELCDAGYEATIETVPYEFQRGGNQMLRVQR
jgi:hypothetical protein